MKNLFLFLVFSFVVIFVGCSNKNKKEQKTTDSVKKTETVLLTKAEYDSLLFKAKKAQYLEEDLKSRDKFISKLKKNPDYFLLVIDSELSALEKNEELSGSFSDFFVPTLYQALDSGVAKKAILERINKLTQLAEKGLFLGSCEEDLFNSGGVVAIIKYIGIE